MLEVYADGRAFGKKGSAFAVILRGKGLTTERFHHWEKSFDCANETSNKAAMRAVDYALRCIKKEKRATEIEMFFSNKYVHSMLAKENGEWKKNSNSDLIIRVRDLLEQFPRIVMVSQSDSELSKKVKSLSENVVSKGKWVDSRKW